MPEQMNVAACYAPVNNEKKEFDASMTEEDLKAEKRGFEYLSKLVKSLRLDTEEVANQIRKSLESTNHQKKAFLRPDGKGRI